MRRHRKLIAVALIALNLSGARVVVASGSCANNGTHFTSSRSFRALIKAALNQERKHSDRRSLGMRTTRHSSWDVKFLPPDNRVAPVDIAAPIPINVPAQQFLERRLHAWKLPSDLSPVQPQHLFSKK